MKNNVEIIQINISGEDKPGMTSSLTEILARYDAFILDIGQANIHQSLTLGILFMTTSDKSGNIMKELLFKSSELGVMIRFTPISEEKYNDWVSRQGKNRYIITLLGRTVTARHIAEVTKVVAEHGLNIDAIKRLTANGYRYIGMDHFAKETDELSVAQKEGSLQRNFQGYSTKAECDMIALGVSSISKIGSAYACNPRELEDYYAAIREGRLATNRGYLLNADDEMRRYVIMTIMCNFELRKRDVEERFGIKFDETFAYELGKMKPYVKHELVELYDDRLVVSAKGKIFVRAVAMHFDRYLRESTRAGGYSRIA